MAPDSLSGLLEPFVDGVPLNVPIAIVDLLNTILRLRLEEGWRYERYREWTSTSSLSERPPCQDRGGQVRKSGTTNQEAAERAAQGSLI